MALSDLEPAERHRRIAGDFTALVQRVTDWDVAAPVAGWTARDVVEHLVTWLPGFLSAGGVALPPGPAVADDPAAAWTFHAAAVQALLDDPERAAALEAFHDKYDPPGKDRREPWLRNAVVMHMVLVREV